MRFVTGLGPTMARVTLVLSASMFLAGCAGSSGGSSDETIVVMLETNEDCYGVAVDVNQAGLSSSELGALDSCVPTTELLALGCDTDTTSSASRYGLSLSGCFAPDNTPLFECTVPKALAERFRNTGTARCGCGCAADCPSAVYADICDENGQQCVARRPDGPAFTSARADQTDLIRVSSGVAQPSSTSSSTTYCGTCCDAQDIDTGVRMTTDVDIREIRFLLDMPINEPQCPDFNGCDAANAFDGPVTYVFVNDTIEVCLSAKEAVNGPLHLISCSVNSDGSNEFLISNVSALDPRLMPVIPAPSILNDFGNP